MSWRVRLSAAGRKRLLCAMGLLTTLAVLGAPALAAAASCPNVHIVLDRSGSMTSLMSGGGTRWSVATQTLNKLVLPSAARRRDLAWRCFRKQAATPCLPSVPTTRPRR